MFPIFILLLLPLLFIPVGLWLSWSVLVIACVVGGLMLLAGAVSWMMGGFSKNRPNQPR